MLKRMNRHSGLWVAAINIVTKLQLLLLRRKGHERSALHGIFSRASVTTLTLATATEFPGARALARAGEEYIYSSVARALFQNAGPFFSSFAR